MKKIVIVIFLILLIQSCIPVQNTLLLPLAAKVITSPQTFDCGGASIPKITIRDTHDVIVQNCNVTGSTDNCISIVDSYNVTVRDFTITKCGSESGAININTTTSTGQRTRNIVIEDCHIWGGGSMGWGVSSSYFNLYDITLRRCLIEDVGQAGGVEKHGLYISNWNGFLIEDVVIRRSYNAGIKIVGNVNNGIFRRVKIEDSGSFGMMFGQLNDNLLQMDNVLLDDCSITGSKSLAIVFYDGNSGFSMLNCVFSGNKGDPPTPVKTPTRTATGSPTPIQTGITPTSTNTPVSASVTASITRTPTATAPTVTRAPSKTPNPVTPTPTLVPSDKLCVRITWWLGVSIRPSANLNNTSLGTYTSGRIIPIEAIETIDADQWARVNYGQFFAIKIGTRVYAKTAVCP